MIAPVIRIGDGTTIDLDAPPEDELSTAVESFTSWTELRSSLKKSKDAADNEPTVPPVVPDGKFATFVADPPWRYGNTSTRGAADVAKCGCPLSATIGEPLFRSIRAEHRCGR